MKRIAPVLFLAILCSPAVAQESDGFVSPSGNIVCAYFGDDMGQSMRCDIGQTNTVPPERPADCSMDMDWGNAFEITARSQQGGRICTGDQLNASVYGVLDYGDSFRRGVFTCQSERTGVTCQNENGAGFSLSRNSQRIF